MNCPGCGAENIDGSKSCRSCGGRLSPSGVDYSGRDCGDYRFKMYFSDLVPSPRTGLALDTPYFGTVLGPIFCAFVFFICGVYCVYRALVDPNEMFLVPAAVLFVIVAAFGYLAFLYLRDMYSEPDTGPEVLASEDGVETSYELTSLPPRR